MRGVSCARMRKRRVYMPPLAAAPESSESFLAQAVKDVARKSAAKMASSGLAKFMGVSSDGSCGEPLTGTDVAEARMAHRRARGSMRGD